MTLLFATFFLLASTLPIFNFQQQPAADGNRPAPACIASPDDPEIYSLIIRELLLQNDDGKTQIVLYDRTSAGFPPGMAASTSFGGKERKELLDSAGSETKINFDRILKLHCSLPTAIEPRNRITFLDAKHEESLFPKGGGNWKRFEKTYPHSTGFTLLSAIAFNGAHDQAMVYLGNSCGMLCGSGYIVLLEKKDDHWSVAKTANIWVS